MIYHFLPQGNYADQFLSFMRLNKKNFSGEHKFLFLSYGENTENKSFCSDDSKDTFDFLSILKIFLCLKKHDAVIIHNYSHPYLYLACACVWWKLDRVVWKVWGGDLYWHTEVKKGKYKIYEFLRAFTIKRFGYVSTDHSEFELIKKYYNTGAKNIYTTYPRAFFEFPAHAPQDYVSILVGNSRDPSNEHIDALRLLSRFKDENIKVYVILSYGDCPDGYVDNINRIGKTYFGDKYIPITEMMDLKTYQQFLSNVDIMVCNHRRQQAWGNLLVMLKYGKKVFIRSGISTEEDFNEYGLKFFLTDNIESMSFSEFVEFQLSDAKQNDAILTKMFSNDGLFSIWNNLFKSIISESALSGV